MQLSLSLSSTVYRTQFAGNFIPLWASAIITFSIFDVSFPTIDLYFADKLVFCRVYILFVVFDISFMAKFYRVSCETRVKDKV